MAERATPLAAPVEGSPDPSEALLVAALGPLLERVGGEVVRSRPQPGDVPVEWAGRVVLHVRMGQGARSGGEPVADLSDGLSRLIEDVEGELGGPLSVLPRAEKQQAVRLLEERGAFEMRRSAETVAEALGVTRFTVYNYLHRNRDEPAT